jgi:hypothetical protein
MKIQIVTERGDWVLPRWSRQWGKRLGASVAHEVTPGYDIYFYVNYGFYHGPQRGLDVCYFTHREEKDPLRSRFDEVAKRCDWCVAQCRKTVDHLDKNKTSVIRPGVDAEFILDEPLRIGVVGRNYDYTDRKRFHWVPMLRTWFPDISFPMASDLSLKDLREFYNGLDYLLVTAKNEGGPMPVVEALSLGVPVIAPEGVGWCDEFSCVRYDSTYEGLCEVIRGLGVPSWDDSASQLGKLFNKLTKR